MPRAVTTPIRGTIVDRHRDDQSLEPIALDLDLRYDTVRNIRVTVRPIRPWLA